MKKTFFLTFLIFLIAFVSSEELIVSPGQLDFKVTQGQVSCKNITISTNGEVLLKDKWEEKWNENKDITFHTFSSEDLKVNLDYSSELLIQGKTKILICFSGEDIGKYHGVLLIRNKNSQSGIGIWINATIQKGEFYTDLLTGSFLKDTIYEESYFGLFLFLFLLLLLVLFLLIKKHKK